MAPAVPRPAVPDEDERLAVDATPSASLVRRAGMALVGANVFFLCSTGLFIYAWRHLDSYQPLTQSVVRHVLVQGHLATENVVAVWYSGMLLLAVGLAALAAYAADMRTLPHGPARRWAAGWLGVSAVFLLLSLDEVGSFHERVGMLPQLNLRGDTAANWVFVLAVPIALVAAGMVGFAWLHLRRVPATWRLMVTAVALFASNPFLELIQMRMLRTGAPDGSWPRLVHDVTLVIEEGGVELFGTLGFLAAIVLYVRAAPAGVLRGSVPARRVRQAALLLGPLMVAGAAGARWIVARLPPGDTGIPENWFAAASCALLALCVIVTHATTTTDPAWRRRAVCLAVVALAVSAWFGAGLHGYRTWHRFDMVRELLEMSLVVGLALTGGAVAARQARLGLLLPAGLILIALGVIHATAVPALPATLGAWLAIAALARPRSALGRDHNGVAGAGAQTAIGMRH